MNQPTAPPPPSQYDAPPPPKKKGLPPLAWVGIGCGALVVIALVIFVAGGMFVAKKARDVVSEFEDNPGMAAAEMMIRVNPDLELIESDRDEGTFTVRQKSTGEVITVDLEDIESGNFSIDVDGQESRVSFGEEGIEVTTEEEGKTSRVQIGGGGGAASIPDWVPIYPGTTPATTFVSSSDDETQGAFSLNTEDEPEEVLEWYGRELASLGITDPDSNSFEAGDTRGGSLLGKTDSGRQINVSALTRDGTTVINVTFDGPL